MAIRHTIDLVDTVDRLPDGVRVAEVGEQKFVGRGSGELMLFDIRAAHPAAALLQAAQG